MAINNYLVKFFQMGCTIMMSVTHNATLNPGIMQNTKAQRWKKNDNIKKNIFFGSSSSHAPVSKCVIFPETVFQFIYFGIRMKISSTYSSGPFQMGPPVPKY